MSKAPSSLPKARDLPPKELSRIVRDAKSQASKDLTLRFQPFGFRRIKNSRAWIRVNPHTIDTIWYNGTRYPPVFASVDFSVAFSVKVLNSRADIPYLSIELLRNARGYAYHTRFNAISGDAYDRCIEELIECYRDHGEPFFIGCRSPAFVEAIPHVSPEIARSLGQSLEGKADPDIVSENLARFGLSMDGSPRES